MQNPQTPAILGQMQRMSAGLAPSQPSTQPLMSLRAQLGPQFQQRIRQAAIGTNGTNGTAGNNGDFLADYVQAVTGPANERVQKMAEIRSGLAGKLTESLNEATTAAASLSADPSVRRAIQDATNHAGLLSTMQSEPGEPLVLESMQKIQRLEEACRSAEANGCPRVSSEMAADEAPKPSSCGCGGHAGILGAPAMVMRSSQVFSPVPSMVMGADNKIDTPIQFVVYWLQRVFGDMQLIMARAQAALDEEDVRLGRKTQEQVAATKTNNG